MNEWVIQSNHMAGKWTTWVNPKQSDTEMDPMTLEACIERLHEHVKIGTDGSPLLYQLMQKYTTFRLYNVITKEEIAGELFDLP